MDVPGDHKEKLAVGSRQLKTKIVGWAGFFAHANTADLYAWAKKPAHPTVWTTTFNLKHTT